MHSEVRQLNNSRKSYDGSTGRVGKPALNRPFHLVCLAYRKLRIRDNCGRQVFWCCLAEHVLSYSPWVSQELPPGNW